MTINAMLDHHPTPFMSVTAEIAMGSTKSVDPADVPCCCSVHAHPASVTWAGCNRGCSMAVMPLIFICCLPQRWYASAAVSSAARLSALSRLGKNCRPANASPIELPSYLSCSGMAVEIHAQTLNTRTAEGTYLPPPQGAPAAPRKLSGGCLAARARWAGQMRQGWHRTGHQRAPHCYYHRARQAPP